MTMDGEQRKAFFLDRDGVILKVRYLEPYPPETPDDKIVSKLVTIDQVQILPGVAAALKRIHDRGYLAVVVTNQGYIERGIITRKGMDAIHDHINDLLAREGAHIDAFYICPHTKGTVCECRKPGTLLFRQAAADFNIDVAASFMVGDRKTDIAAGRAAGCRESFLVRRGGWGERTLASLGDKVDFPVCEDLADVVSRTLPE